MLKTHRSETFKLSKDPLFIEKVRDIVGLYLNPPDRALVLATDEKSQIQALDRSQPMLRGGGGGGGGRRKTPGPRRGPAPSRCCRWGRARSNGGPMTTSATAQRPCLLRWTSR